MTVKLLHFQFIHEVSSINYLGIGRRRDLWPLAPPFIRGVGGAVDKLAEMDRKARKTHQRLALNITSQWNPFFSQEVSPFFLQQLSRLRRKKGVSFTFRPLFLSFSWPGVGIETESKQSGLESISYLNAHIVCGKTVISLFSLLCTKLAFPGARHRWRYKVLAFWRHCLGHFFFGWESII